MALEDTKGPWVRKCIIGVTQLQTVCATPTHQESIPTSAIVAQLENVRTLCY